MIKDSDNRPFSITNDPFENFKTAVNRNQLLLALNWLVDIVEDLETRLAAVENAPNTDEILLAEDVPPVTKTRSRKQQSGSNPDASDDAS